MAKVFFPRDSVLIPASCPPHPPGTEYKISYGDEQWENHYVPVFKVQMVYNGDVSGRRSPSYPVGTDDYKRVHDAMMQLFRKYNGFET